MPATSSSPSAVLLAATNAELPSRQLSTVESITLVQALGAVPDPRHRRGRRHSLQSVLLLALGAVLAGAQSYAASADWAADAGHAVAVGGPAPHASTIRRLLSRLDTAALEAALTRWVLSRRQVAAAPEATGGGPAAEGRPVLAVDGKTLRGARCDGRRVHQLAAMDHTTRVVLAQRTVDGAPGEIGGFQPLLADLDLTGWS